MRNKKFTAIIIFKKESGSTDHCSISHLKLMLVTDTSDKAKYIAEMLIVTSNLPAEYSITIKNGHDCDC